MQKFIIAVTADALIKADARFIDATQTRGTNAVDVVLKYPDGMTVGVECFRDQDSDLVKYTTTVEAAMDDVTGDFGALGIPYMLTVEEGRGIRVNVLDLLKAGLLIHAPANTNTLKVTLPLPFNNGEKVTLDYRNDGTSLWADYVGIDSDDSEDIRSGVLAILEACLTEHKIIYEVL